MGFRAPTNNNRKQALGAAVAGESDVVELSHPDGITLESSDVTH